MAARLPSSGWSPTTPPTAASTTCSCVPEYRGRGYAKALLETLLAHPSLQGLRRLSLGLRQRQRAVRAVRLQPRRSIPTRCSSARSRTSTYPELTGSAVTRCGTPPRRRSCRPSSRAARGGARCGRRTRPRTVQRSVVASPLTGSTRSATASPASTLSPSFFRNTSTPACGASTGSTPSSGVGSHSGAGSAPAAGRSRPRAPGSAAGRARPVRASA